MAMATHETFTNGPSSDRPSPSGPTVSDAEYKVGPGRPPKEFQFKRGQSGNPKGAKRKPRSVAPDLKALFERALSKPVTLKQGDKQQIVTMAAAGIEQTVAQFAKGDRHARRDVFWLAEKLGVDLLPGQDKAIEQALPFNHQEIALAYALRQYDLVVPPSPVLAPPELLDDDPENQNRS
jgi:Family of unknown function (DUF5681)